MRRAPLWAAAALLAVAACDNAGKALLVSVTASGVVKGQAYLDRNGSGTLDNGDTAFAGLKVILATTTGDSVRTVVAGADGVFRADSLPVGRYTIRVDVAPLGDTMIVASQDSMAVSVLPADSAIVFIGVSYPHVTVAQARTMPRNRRVFFVGIALSTKGMFRDTTVSVQDTTRAVRLDRIRAPSIFAGDSSRFFGTTSQRDGQPTMIDVFVAAAFGTTFLPAPRTVTSLVAARADDGVLDASHARVLRAIIEDTATVGSDFRLTVDDSSGNLEVLLDPTADPSFTPANQALTATYVPGKKFTITGILVPTGVPNTWRLKPRSSAELVPEP